MPLEKFLEFKGWSHGYFAEKLGVGRTTVTKWVGGQTPNARHMHKIMQATEGYVTANDFFSKQPACPKRNTAQDAAVSGRDAAL